MSNEPDRAWEMYVRSLLHSRGGSYFSVTKSFFPCAPLLSRSRGGNPGGNPKPSAVNYVRSRAVLWWSTL